MPRLRACRCELRRAMDDPRDGCSEHERQGPDDAVDDVVVAGADDDEEDHDRIDECRVCQPRPREEPDRSRGDENREPEVLARRGSRRVVEEGAGRVRQLGVGRRHPEAEFRQPMWRRKRIEPDDERSGQESQRERRADDRVARGREQARGGDEGEQHRQVDVRVEPRESRGDARVVEPTDDCVLHVQRQRSLESQHVVRVGEGRRDVAFDRNPDRVPREQHERDEHELGLHRVRPLRIFRRRTHSFERQYPKPRDSHPASVTDARRARRDLSSVHASDAQVARLGRVRRRGCRMRRQRGRAS